MTATMPMAATPDDDDIVGVAQLSINGGNAANLGKLKQAFHENAWIFFTDAAGIWPTGRTRGLTSMRSSGAAVYGKA